MATPTLNPEVQNLLTEIQRLYPSDVQVQFGTEQSGYVRHDQSQQSVDPQTQALTISVNDVTAPNYTASHELMHLLMLLEGYPQLYFSLTTGRQNLDEQLMAIATELYDIAAHAVVVANQQEHQLIDDEIRAEYLKGIYATIQPENPEKPDAMMTLRLLTLADAIVFYGDQFQTVEEQLKADFPTSLVAAQKLVQAIFTKPVKSPFGLRRAVVKAFVAFDEQMTAWTLPLLHGQDFVTLQSVFSDRQTRLKVNQLFEVYHSEMLDRDHHTRAYVGYSKSDHQNSFVVTAPKNMPSDEYFRQLYAMQTKDLFESIPLPYSTR